MYCFFFFFSSRRRHTRLQGDWSSDVCSSDLRQETALAARHDHRGACAILHEAEAKHEANGPNPDENEKRERAIKTQQGLTGFGLRDEADDESPRFPGRAVKKPSKAELSRDAARENDGLEGVPQDDQKDRDTYSERSGSWNHVRHCTCLALSMRTSVRTFREDVR